MRHVFLSYRRDDTQYITGFICRELTAPTGFGPDSVFMDIDGIPPGVDFREVIDEHVAQCRFFLAVIGKQWATIKDDDGRVRLHNPNDFVRLEIETALKRDIPVVPLLVDGAKMPRADELPESLRPLVFKNATTIRPGARQFAEDIERLVKGLLEAEEWKKRRASPPPPPPIDTGAERERLRRDLEEYRRVRVQSGLVRSFFEERAEARFGEWLAAADAGDTGAMNLVGLAHSFGLGPTQNQTEAVRWYRRAAAAGDAAAMNSLGNALYYGWGVSQDYAEAARWYRQAADLGDAAAMVNLGYAFGHGEGVSRNDAEAVLWLRRAAKLGDLDAKEALRLFGVSE